MMIRNKKVKFNYDIIETYTAGIKLVGSEVKSLRIGNSSINESFCYVENDEVYIRNMYIKENEFSSYLNHKEFRDRKLLLNKSEILKMIKKVDQKGMTIVPLSIFLNDRGLFKVNLAVAKGKRDYQKKDAKKLKDLDRDMKRDMKSI